MLINNPHNIDNPFFRSVPYSLIIPMLILSTLATIIASQALISGKFFNSFFLIFFVIYELLLF